MNKFSAGDRIRVVTDRWDNSDYIQKDRVGTILGELPTHTTWWKVKLDGNNAIYNYQEIDIEHYADFVMPEPEMELDEIHRADELMEGK